MNEPSGRMKNSAFFQFICIWCQLVKPQVHTTHTLLMINVGHVLTFWDDKWNKSVAWWYSHRVNRTRYSVWGKSKREKSGKRKNAKHTNMQRCNSILHTQYRENTHRSRVRNIKRLMPFFRLTWGIWKHTHRGKKWCCSCIQRVMRCHMNCTMSRRNANGRKECSCELIQFIIIMIHR